MLTVTILIFCRFDLIKHHLMEFNQLAMANSEGSDDMLNRVMTKDNIGLAALLVTKPGAYPKGKIKDGSWYILSSLDEFTL